jgi:hypothetical protein
MAMSVAEIMEWLETFDDDDMIGIDDGGLALRPVNAQELYCEVGGIPEDDESDDVENEIAEDEEDAFLRLKYPEVPKTIRDTFKLG